MPKSSKQQWTIVQNSTSLRYYRHEIISDDFLSIIDRIKSELNKSDNSSMLTLLKLFECFLQLTQQEFSTSDLSKNIFKKIINQFAGALLSKKFINAGIATRRAYVNCLFNMLEQLQKHHFCIKIERQRISKISCNSILENGKSQFEAMTLNSQKVYYWTGWWLENKTGKQCFSDFTAIYKKFGYSFTEQLYSACKEYFYTRDCNGITLLPELCSYLVSSNYTEEQLKKSNITTKFFEELLIYTLKKHAESGNNIRVVITHWRNRLIPFSKEYLIGRIFAEPYGALPMPPSRYISGKETCIVTLADGQEVKEKLLTKVPLEVSDSEAMELLFYQIEADINHIIECAMDAAKKLINRFERRKLLSKQGTVIERKEAIGYNIKKTEKHILANSCATFEFNGFELNGSDRKLKPFYPYPYKEIAFQLALPTCYSLIPFLFLLVAEHPTITASFLDHLELYDKCGKRSGYIEIDMSRVLISYKKRRGAKDAQQTIVLTKRSQWIVEWIVKLTQEARDFLKSKNDDSWRYLLLSSGQGFSYPSRITHVHKSIYSWKQQKSPDDFYKSLQNPSSGMNDLHVTQLIQRLNLSSLRASCGVQVYLKTRSVSKMATALGHKRYNTQTLSHYLPESIRSFFQSRWIQIFQEGIIVEALKGSTCLLEATTFKNIEELDQFLSQHALKLMPDNQKHTIEEKEGSIMQKEVIFGVDVTILTILISLKDYAETSSKIISAKAKYWSEIAKYLIGHIESKPDIYEEAYAYLKIAKEKAKCFSLEGIFNV